MADLVDIAWKLAGVVISGLGAAGVVATFVLGRFDAINDRIAAVQKEIHDGDAALGDRIEASRKESREGDADLRREFLAAIKSLDDKLEARDVRIFNKIDAVSDKLDKHREYVQTQVTQFMPSLELKVQLDELREELRMLRPVAGE